MQPYPSRQCHFKTEDSKSEVKVKQIPNAIDLTISRGERRLSRKISNAKQPSRKDQVRVVDLPGTADYDIYFSECIDENIKLNIKGPFSNLYWSFTGIDETTICCNIPQAESTETQTEIPELEQTDIPELEQIDIPELEQTDIPKLLNNDERPVSFY